MVLGQQPGGKGTLGKRRRNLDSQDNLPEDAETRSMLTQGSGDQRVRSPWEEG